ncbi:ABC transporter permease [Holzapfeliella sp. He02]|uniref:ABC transporter permease n=1 Tax=Holzapfeliella saturejae TaxID=3082953 RepID=A0ABU8SIY7_9LACO
MKALYQTRLKKNLVKQFRYLQLVFNDHFLLALIIGMGGLLFWYADIMKRLPENQWFYGLIISVILFIPYLFGKLATFLDEADQQFLWAKDDEMMTYFKPAKNYSLALPLFFILLVSVVLLPLVYFKMSFSLVGYLIIVVGLMAAKYLNIELQAKKQFAISQNSIKIISWIQPVMLLAIIGSFYLFSPLVLLVAVIGIIWSRLKLDTAQASFDWRQAVLLESRRQEMIYAFYSLFTDVKERTTKIKRRQYLDQTLNWFVKNPKKQSPQFFLFKRTLIRNPEYLNLLVRMTAFALILMVILDNTWFTLIMGIFIIFLTGYQLLPLYNQYDRHLMYFVMPFDASRKFQDFKILLTQALLLESIVLSIGMLIKYGLAVNVWITIVSVNIFVIIFTYGYLSLKLKAKK